MFKVDFHFNRSVFLSFLSTIVQLMTSKQKKMLCYVAIRLKWKTAIKGIGYGIDLNVIWFVRLEEAFCYVYLQL